MVRSEPGSTTFSEVLTSLACDLLKALPSCFRGGRDDLLRELREELRRQTQTLDVLQAVLLRLGGSQGVQY